MAAQMILLVMQDAGAPVFNFIDKRSDLKVKQYGFLPFLCLPILPDLRLFASTGRY